MTLNIIIHLEASNDSHSLLLLPSPELAFMSYLS